MTSLHTEREVPHDVDQEVDTMSRRYDAEPDREISLNTSTLLLLFFALALVCSGFFGLGYTMGRKSTPPMMVASSDSHTESLRDAFKSFKPSPGGAAVEKTSEQPAKSVDPDEPVSRNAVVVPAAGMPVSTAKAAAVAAPSKKAGFDPDAEIVTESSKPIGPHAATAVAAVATGTALVQVAAVSHQEDADVLLSALKRKGYTVVVRQEPQDRLLHIQLGPYPSKKDAEAMRQRLLADGYNAILK